MAEQPGVTQASRRVPALSSSDASIDAGYRWAVDRALEWVQTDRGAALPSYWAGLTDRPMFYSRDVAHQALGAHLLGLDDENLAMLRHFADSATARRRFTPLWAFNFDGTPAKIDYRSDKRFVRETPVAFEIVERCLEQLRWTSDERYRNDPVFRGYYEQTLTSYVEAHDVLGWSVAGASGVRDIFAGTATYNEGPRGPGMQIAGDGIASQWAALSQTADVFAAEPIGAWAAAEAVRIRRLFEERFWSDELGRYVTGFAATGAVVEFAYEPSWFPAVKGIMQPDRAQSQLDYISRELELEPPANIEAFTYLPEAYFAYGRDREALRWIRHLIDSRAEYPEVSYTVVSHLVAGLTGLRPLARDAIETRSHFGEGTIEVADVPIQGRRITLRHERASSSMLTVVGGESPVRWIAWHGEQRTESLVQPGETVDVKV